MDDLSWMHEALQLAREAYHLGEVPVGAIIVKDDTIVGRGCNQPISSCDPTAHAEVVAMRDAARHLANYRMPNTTLYVTIEPCSMCLGAIIHARIERVVFGATEPKAGALCSHPEILNKGIFNHQLTWQGGVAESACTEIMQDFFRQRRAQKKIDKQNARQG